jgi:hypothetical protein
MYMGKKEYMMVKEGPCDGFDVVITCEVCKWSQWEKITEPPFVLAGRVLTERCLAVFLRLRLCFFDGLFLSFLLKLQGTCASQEQTHSTVQRCKYYCWRILPVSHLKPHAVIHSAVLLFRILQVPGI